MVTFSYKISEFWLSANEAGNQNFEIENTEKKWLSTLVNLKIRLRFAIIRNGLNLSRILLHIAYIEQNVSGVS